MTITETADGGIMISIPYRFTQDRKKRIIQPDGEEMGPWVPPPELTPLQEDLVQAHRWQRELLTGEVTSQRALADREGLDQSRISRVMNLALLSPEIVRRILADDPPPASVMTQLRIDPPVLWAEQEALLA